MNNQLLHQILTSLDRDNGSTIYDVLLQTLRSHDPAHSRHRESIVTRIPNILDILLEQAPVPTVGSALALTTTTYREEMQSLIQAQTGFHFKGTTASLLQLETFSIADMGQRIRQVALHLWNLVGVLLDATTSRRRVAPDENMDVDEDLEIELDDIATVMLGNDDGSEESDEDGSDEGDAPVGAHTTADNEESEEELELESTTQPKGPKPAKRRYRKQNRAKRNAALLFIVSG